MRVHSRSTQPGVHALAALSGSLLVALFLLVSPARAAVPANDDLASAEPIAGESGSVAGENVEATREAGEPEHGGPGGPSVWYRWQAPFTGRVVFETCGEHSFDTLLAVYTGNVVSALQQLAADDDSCAVGSRVSVAVSADVVYHVAVDGYGGESGRFTLQWRRVVTPANDDFASARTIVGIRGQVAGTNVGSSAEPGEPRYLSGTSVWFRWRAPRTMPVLFSTCGARFDTLLGAFRGPAVSRLTRLAWNDDACGLASRIRLQATRGVAYHVAVAGLDGSGPFRLTWQPAPCLVPRLRGSGLAQARVTLARAGCTTGLVRYVSSPIAPRGRVVAQWPPAGTRLPYLGRVRLAVSRGPGR